MKLLALLLVVVAVHAKHEEYAGWKSYFVGATTQEQLTAMAGMVDRFELDFLGRPALGREQLILVKPKYQTAFTKGLEALGISYRVHVEDAAETFRQEDKIIEERERVMRAKRAGARIPFDNYQRVDVYDAYLEEMANRYSDRVTLVTFANSFQGRPIKGLRISTSNFADSSKPLIVIDGGIHSREWISPPSVAWMIHKLLEDVTEPDLVNNFDWIIIPVLNPDGYEFSFTNNRMWRKTRSTDSSPLSFMCPGVDGNRNYDFFWDTVGTSPNPCSDVYAGSHAFSEVETRVIRDILLEYRSRISLYLTMHSFGSMILYPWGHDGSLSPNAFALQVVGVGMADAIFSNQLPSFPRYIVGNSVLVIGYAAAGASEDYAHSIGIDLSFTYELPGFAPNGFILDPSLIEQVCRDTWEGIIVGARMSGDYFRRKQMLAQ